MILSLDINDNKSKYLGHTFLICWITLPADLKNWDFKKKKKKKKRIWRSSGKKRKLQVTMVVAETL